MISSTHLHVRPMRVHRTCRRAKENNLSTALSSGQLARASGRCSTAKLCVGFFVACTCDRAVTGRAASHTWLCGLSRLVVRSLTSGLVVLCQQAPTRATTQARAAGRQARSVPDPTHRLPKPTCANSFGMHAGSVDQLGSVQLACGLRVRRLVGSFLHVHRLGGSSVRGVGWVVGTCACAPCGVCPCVRTC